MEIIITLISILAGVILGRLTYHERPLGDLRVDRSDPTSEPYLFLELDADIRTIMSKKRAVFRVKIEDFITHE